MDRDDPELERWARAVKVDANFTCEICSARGVYLEAHHKNGFNAFPEQRLDLENGACLYHHYHQRFHDTYGYGGNTKYQFEEYKQVAELLRKLASSKSPPAFLSQAPEDRDTTK